MRKMLKNRKYMQKKYESEKKRGGQVRGERSFSAKKVGKPMSKTAKPVREERINGAPVYTATYKVNRSDELMEFLLKKCNTSRNNVKSLLVRKQVLVNGRVVTQYNYALAKDDEVKLSRRPVKDGVVAKQPTMAKRGVKTAQPTFSLRDLKIVYEDEDFIAIDKPVGLLSVESDKETACAYSLVAEYMQRADKTARPFILHRIDKETSGVLVFAKNIKIHSMLKMHWAEQVQLREYYAVVDGAPEEKSATIMTYLKENVNNVVYSTKDPTGQKAITHYETLKANEQYALLRVKIDTGRKNQIRVHMQSLNCPIVGDDKYGKKQDGTSVRNPLGRLGLHASRLEFIHPVKKEVVSIAATVPAAFRGLF
jgi:23S rRNA pseudouridine1911/1915/1917 synthase